MLHSVSRTTIKSKQKAAQRLSQERRGRDGQKGDGEIRMTGKKKNHRVAALLASISPPKKVRRKERERRLKIILFDRRQDHLILLVAF